MRLSGLSAPSRGSFAASAVAFLIALSLLIQSPQSAEAEHTVCEGDGLLNAGFEDGHLDGSPACWDVDQPVADAVVVVDTETSAEFQAYGGQTGVGSVVPHEGSLMLRLGTPNRQNEAQSPKPDRVSQTFTPTGSSLRFAFRLFSWEHRGIDRFAFNLTDENGETVPGTVLSSGLAGGALSSGLSIALPDGGSINCAAIPCSSTIDTGGRQDFLDSGWRVVQIDAIPVGALPGDGRVTLTYEAGGTNNNSIPTWAYFDAAPAPPTAQFELSFVPVEGAGFTTDVDRPLEGTVVQFIDLSSDPDGDIVSWAWTVTDPNGDSITSSDQFPILVPPQQGQYAIELTVTDGDGNSSTAASGQVVGALTMPYLEVRNAPPIVDATNLEVLEATEVDLLGAYIDGGWLDSHTAAFSIPGLSPGDVEIDAVSEPALASGVVTAPVEIPASSSSFNGTLAVTDDSGDSGSDDFAITVVPADASNREPNDTLSTVFDPSNPGFEAPSLFLATDGSYLSYLQGADTRDFFEIRWAGQNEPLPANSELLVSLAPPPGADYDLALIAINEETQSLGQQFVGQQFVGQQFVGQQFVGQQFVGQQFVGQQFVGQQFVGQQFVGQQFVGQQFVGQQFVGQQFVGQQFVGQQFVGQQFVGDIFGPDYEINGFQLNALSQIAALDGSTVGSADITIDELGLDLPIGVTVLGFAANSGDAEERLLVSITEPGTRVFAVVIRENNPSTTDPYRVTVRGSAPLLSVADASGVSLTQLNTAFNGLDDLVAACEVGAPLVTSGATSSAVTLHNGGGGSPLTVFVTQRERLAVLYGEDAVAAMETSLFALADHPAIQGLVISVPSTIYDAWDQSPCSVQAANEVTEEIRSLLTPYLDEASSVENVVLVGNDNVVPFRRVADTTVVGNERNYALGTFLTPGSPLFHAVDGGYILTQDYYVDRVPTPYEGGALYVPDLPIGRLIETPPEIAASSDAFVASNGLLNVATASVAGYDFFEDHANAVAQELASAGVGTNSLVNSGWTGADLRCQWGLDTAADGCGAPPDLSDQSAHYTHWAALSAGGYFNANYGDYVTSEEISSTGANGSFVGHLGFTIGCHAGFSAPDEDAAGGLLPFDPSLDLPQAMAQARAVWVASTGYAIGDDEALNYTELLMLRYTQQLLGGAGTAGGSLVNAKELYLGSLGTITNYDQKVSIEMTLYGLPQYVVDTPSGAAIASIESTIQSLPIVTLEPGPGSSLTETVLIDPTIETIVAVDGTYQTADGDSEAIVARPRMPRVVSELEEVADNPVHGAILVGGLYTSTPNFDPLIAAPLTEWGLPPDEPQVCLPIFWPSPVRLNGIGSDIGISQRLIVYPASFRCDTPPGDPVRGEYREFQEQTVRIYRSDSSDFRPPIIEGVQLIEGASGGGIVISVEASDSGTGIGEVVAVRYRNGVVSSVSQLIDEPLPSSGTFTVEFPDFDADDQFVVHVIDGAGNVATDSAKGNLIHFIEVDAGPDQFVAAEQPVTFTGMVFEFGPNADNDGLFEPVEFQWSFGDGLTLSGALSADNPDLDSFSVDGNGTATFQVTHTYSANVSGLLEATLFIEDGAGSTGLDTANIYVCGDPRDVNVSEAASVDPTQADLVGCDVEVDGDAMTITLFTDGALEVDGTPTTGSISYRLRVGLATETSAKQLMWRDGSATGMKSLEVAVDGNSISFTFSLKELGKKGQGANAAVIFSAETRAGVESTGGAGLLDQLPDGGASVTFPPWP